MKTRFAPSPTGELHLGHVLHASVLWETAARFGAQVPIRIEDHDRSRSTAAFEASIIDDIAWLGFHPEAPSLASLRSHPSPWRQSDHPERYQAAFERLRERGLLYGCTCTRAELPVTGPHHERCYPGRCRGRPVDIAERHVVRMMLPDERVAFDDLQLGHMEQHPAQLLGDIAVRDAAGQWTYQFCVVVDDLHDQVDLIVRGEDLLTSTGTQWLLAKELGRAEPPVTLHHPLLLDAAGHKLSKRDRSETVRVMRGRGMSREEVIAAAGGVIST